MTSQELGKYFQTIGINNELLEIWLEVNQIADLSKYAGQIPTMVRIKKDIEDAILDEKIPNTYQDAFDYMMKIKDDLVKS